MPDKVFLDSNIVIYLYSQDEMAKKTAAEALFNMPDIRVLITQQVLCESANVFVHKFNVAGLDVVAALREIIASVRLVWTSPETVFSAVKLQSQYRYSFWDSMIIASALENGCSVLYTEDLQHGQVIEKQLSIVNPFI